MVFSKRLGRRLFGDFGMWITPAALAMSINPPKGTAFQLRMSRRSPTTGVLSRRQLHVLSRKVTFRNRKLLIPADV